MNFDAYYNGEFRRDVQEVVRAARGIQRHEGWDGEVIIQLPSLSRENRAIAEMGSDRLAQFAVALYFTILVDEVMYTYFRGSYPRFRELTMYPKLVGGCPGGCHTRLEPELVFRVINGGLRDRGSCLVAPTIEPRYLKALRAATPDLQREVGSFFQEHMPGVDDGAVWRHCIAEPPLNELVNTVA